IKNLDGPGKIIVDARIKNDQLMIEVKDNGVGFDLVSIDKTNVAQLSGIGIDNVLQRIKLYCGSEYGLVIDSVKNEGTIVTITLALNLNENNVKTE
ncbi:MAG: hypothetical protein RR766_03035, partial [Longicatena sp.]